MDTCLHETGTRRTIWVARALHGVAAAVAAVRADLSRPAMNRRVLHRLSTLSERELKDIGLTPQDVVDAAARANGDAMNLLLARREEDRRAHTGSRRPR